MAAFVSVLLLLGLFPSFISIILAETVRKELRTKESIDDNFIQVEQPLQYNRIDPSRVIQLSWRPRVFLYQGFLSNVECDHLISLAKRKQENSAGNDGNFQDDVIAARIEDRMSAWTFLPKENSKPMQILRFGREDAKQKYDYFGNKSMSIQNEPLMATVILYLSDVTHGGQILFPELKDEDSRRKIKIWSDCEKASIIRPIKGNALLFFNTHLNASPDKSSSHVRCPVLEGELWYATKFFNLKPSLNKEIVLYSKESDCIDEDENCPRWASIGECRRNPVFMLGSEDYYGTCRKSCNSC